MRIRTIIHVVILALCLTPTTDAMEGHAVEIKDSSMHQLLSQVERIDCIEYAWNLEPLLTRLYDEGKTDSVATIVAYLKRQCQEHLYPIEECILLRLSRGESVNDCYDCDVIAMLPRGVDNPATPIQWWPDYANRALEMGFELADSNDEGYLWTLYISGRDDEFFGLLKSDRYQNTHLRQCYDRATAELKRNWKYRDNYALRVGGWLPTGNLSIVGEHPSIGFVGGLRTGQDWYLEGMFDISFLDAPEEYTIDDDGTMITTDRFLNLYVGGELSRGLFNLSKFRIEGTFALGWESITVNAGTKSDPNYTEVASCSGSLGLAVRRYLDRTESWYLRIYAGYRVLDFNNHKGSSLSGDLVSVGVAIGYFRKNESVEILDKLHYYD